MVYLKIYHVCVLKCVISLILQWLRFCDKSTKQQECKIIKEILLIYCQLFKICLKLF